MKQRILYLAVATVSFISLGCDSDKHTEPTHTEPTHEERMTTAPSEAHKDAYHNHMYENISNPHLEPPAPAGERMLFATGATEGADGTIYMHDPYCRITDDGTSCPDGYGVCSWYGRCNTYDPITGFNYAASLQVIALDEIADPCQFWYIDKSDSTYWIRAQDAYEVTNERIQEVVFPADGSGAIPGYVSCRQQCKADDACVGGFTYRQRDAPYWAIQCVLLRSSDTELSGVGEASFPYPFVSAGWQTVVERYFLARDSLLSGVFSVCTTHEDDLTVLGIPAAP